MKAIALDYRARTLSLRDTPEPGGPGAGEVRFRVHEAGICGTDRELALFRFGYPPAGSDYLVLGHEALGQVTETGSGVAGLAPGDWVVPAVRRSCHPPCASCSRGRRDLCLSGRAPERGIFGLHGYLAEFAVDDARDLTRVPGNLVPHAVLIEPLSVAEKAVSCALSSHRGEPRTALVFGAGPIGLLAALVLREAGLTAAVCSLEPPDHPRAKLARTAGFEYVSRPGAVKADVAIEATGSAEAAFHAVRSLAALGVLVVLGSPSGTGEFPFPDLIVNNLTVIGSVNAGPEAFQAAVRDLSKFDPRTLAGLICRERFAAAVNTIAGLPGDVPKVVHVLPG